jgi:hypothetical protein
MSSSDRETGDVTGSNDKAYNHHLVDQGMSEQRSTPQHLSQDPRATGTPSSLAALVQPTLRANNGAERAGQAVESEGFRCRGSVNL